jgi:hypothetical protein
MSIEKTNSPAILKNLELKRLAEFTVSKSIVPHFSALIILYLKINIF